MVEIGLISDTHGLVRPALEEVLAGVELILHAGDVGSQRVLDLLSAIAPVAAVSGNVDGFELGLPSRLRREWEGVTVHVSHGHELGSPSAERLLARYAEDLLVFGHTHKPVVFRQGRRLVVNPGAAGPRRFNLMPSVARVTLHDGQADARILPLPL